MNLFVSRMRKLIFIIGSAMGFSKNEKLLRFLYHLKNKEFKKLYLDYPVLANDVKNYLCHDSTAFTFEMIRTEGRTGFVHHFNDKLVMKLHPSWSPSDQIWMSFAVREPLSPEYGAANIAVETSIENLQNEIIYTGKFEACLSGGNALFLHLYGTGWISWFLPLQQFSAFTGQALRLNFQATLIDSKSKDSLPAPDHSIFIGFPQVVKTKKRPKKIIFISCESLTDPFALKSAFPVESKAISPNVWNLMEKYQAAHLSYAQGDSTLPSSNAQFTGLLPLQHGIGSYNSSESTPNIPVRNEQMLSIAQILKRNGFLTFGASIYEQLDAGWGCARGFDSYINVDTSNDPFWPSLENSVFPSLESARKSDSYHYAHLEFMLHVPYVNARYPVFSDLNNFLDLAHQENQVNLYIKNLNRAFDQLSVLDAYIEKHRDEMDFLVMIVGDHGHGLAPWWGPHGDYALYEQRIRVPFMMYDTSGIVTDYHRNVPVCASIESFRRSLQFAGIPLPEQIATLPQFRKEFQGWAISETILHPDDDDYCLAISNHQFKYATLLKLDYDGRKMLSVVWERLFLVENGIANETTDMKERFTKEWQQLKSMAHQLVDESLKFNSKFPAQSFLDSSKAWSVKDPMSPSKQKRRAKKIR